MILHVFKARPTIATRPVEDLVIRVERDVPEFKSLEEAAAVYQKEGEALAAALFAHLPGGAVDAVLMHMMQRRASLFCVRFEP